MKLSGLRIFFLFRWSFVHFYPFSYIILVGKLFGRLSSFVFQLNGHSIIFKFDLPFNGN